MGFFSRKRRAVKSWRKRALLIDPKKTKLTLVFTKDSNNLPAWVYKEFTNSKQETANDHGVLNGIMKLSGPGGILTQKGLKPIVEIFSFKNKLQVREDVLLPFNGFSGF